MFNYNYNKRTKYLVLFTHKMMSTVLKYVQNDCERRFIENWIFGRNNSLFSQKNKKKLRKYENVGILTWKQAMRKEKWFLFSVYLYGVKNTRSLERVKTTLQWVGYCSGSRDLSKFVSLSGMNWWCHILENFHLNKWCPGLLFGVIPMVFFYPKE